MFQPSSLPHEVQDALSVVDEFFAQDPAAIAPKERAAWLAGLQRLRSATEAFELSMLAAFDANGDGETLHCARSTTSWLKGALHISGAEASRRVRLSRQSRSELRPVVDRLRAGEVTLEQVRIIGDAVGDVPEEHTDEAVQVLTDLATQVGVQEVANAARHLREVLNPDGALTSCEGDFNRRRFYMSPLLDGMVAVQGVFDPESAAKVQTALDPFMLPSDPTDERDPAQRRADGLVELANVAMTQGHLSVTGGRKPQLNVLTSLETLIGAERAPGSTLAPDGGVIGQISTERIACDANVSRILMNSEGIPVAMGRSVRLFTPQQRQLLALRDGGCRFPDCGLPPAFTDAHHVVAWQHGGETNLDNAMLACRFHHRHLHEGGWSVEPDLVDSGANASLTFTGPRGQVLRSSPRNLSFDQLSKIAWWDRSPPD